MTWLRIDDKMLRHPKILELTDREFRVYMRALCYCAEYGTAGKLTPRAARDVGITILFARKLVKIRLLDDLGNGAAQIHDWDIYNPGDPTAKQRKQRWKTKQAARLERHKNTNGTPQERVPTPARPFPYPKELTKDVLPTGTAENPSTITDQIQASLDAARAADA